MLLAPGTQHRGAPTFPNTLDSLTCSARPRLLKLGFVTEATLQPMSPLLHKAREHECPFDIRVLERLRKGTGHSIAKSCFGRQALTIPILHQYLSHTDILLEGVVQRLPSPGEKLPVIALHCFFLLRRTCNNFTERTVCKQLTDSTQLLLELIPPRACLAGFLQRIEDNVQHARVLEAVPQESFLAGRYKTLQCGCLAQPARDILQCCRASEGETWDCLFRSLV